MASKSAKPTRPRDSMGHFRSKASEARSRAARRAPRKANGQFAKKPRQSQNRRK